MLRSGRNFGMLLVRSNTNTCETMKQPVKQFDQCRVMRRCLVTHSIMRPGTGQPLEFVKSEWEIKPCAVPLFSNDNREIGMCRSCLEGWQCDENYPVNENGERIQLREQKS